jgi:hypothetical protein
VQESTADHCRDVQAGGGHGRRELDAGGSEASFV